MYPNVKKLGKLLYICMSAHLTVFYILNFCQVALYQIKTMEIFNQKQSTGVGFFEWGYGNKLFCS